MIKLTRKDHLSHEDAIAACCPAFGMGREEIAEHLRIVGYGTILQSVPPAQPSSPKKFSGPPPQLPSERDPWQKILRALKAKINPHSFETWMRPIRYLGEQDGVLYVRIPTAEFKHVGEKYADLIREAMDSLGMEYRDVQFEEAEPGP